MLQTERNERFVRCDCFTHALVVSVEKDDDYVNVALWSYGRGDSLSWKERLRYMWRILTKGKPYEDAVVISYLNGYELGKFLVEQCAEAPAKANRMTMSWPSDFK